MTKKLNASRKSKEELNALVNLVTPERQAAARKITERILFMESTLVALEKEIAVSGVVELFEQGKQRFRRENPALKSYNATIQRYALMYKQLINLLPGEKVKEAADEFDTFLKS